MSQSENPSSDRVRIRVLRLSVGVPVRVRFLSPSVEGLFTHWVGSARRGDSAYCEGTGCRLCAAGRPRSWRGYAACERRERDTQSWVPCVVEITESCELDLREHYQRGGVWILERDPLNRKKNGPVVPVYVENLDSKLLPAPFEIIPVLRRLFGVSTIELGRKNPAPPRVYAATSSDNLGAEPCQLAEPLRPGPIDPELKARWEQMRSKMNRGASGARRIAAPSENGHPS